MFEEYVGQHTTVENAEGQGVLREGNNLSGQFGRLKISAQESIFFSLKKKTKQNKIKIKANQPRPLTKPQTKNTHTKNPQRPQKKQQKRQSKHLLAMEASAFFLGFLEF